MYSDTQCYYYLDNNRSINLATNREGLQGKWTQNREDFLEAPHGTLIKERWICSVEVGSRWL